MASTNKTKNILLNRWVEDDKPRMEDFNQDNEILDREIANRYTKTDVDSLLSKKVNMDDLKWTNVTLNEGIVGSSVRYCRFGKIVFIDGWLIKADINSIIFTLPKECCPSRDINLIVTASSLDALNHATARVCIKTDGSVRIPSISSERAFKNNGCSLNVVFLAQ